MSPPRMLYAPISLAALMLASAVNPAHANRTDSDLGCKQYPPLPHTRLLVVGEIHGTSETPDLVAEQACRLAEDGSQVIVGLEIPRAEQPVIDEYLSSLGDEPARNRLLTGRFWLKQDGRASLAMFDLIERIRTLKAKSADVTIVAFDAESATGIPRDQAMADRISTALDNRPQAKMIVLIGNFHAGKQPSPSHPPTEPPAASYLSGFSPYTVLAWAKHGRFWACMEGRCGEQSVSNEKDDIRAPGLIPGAVPMPGFDALYLFDQFTISAPAISVDG